MLDADLEKPQSPLDCCHSCIMVQARLQGEACQPTLCQIPRMVQFTAYPADAAIFLQGEQGTHVYVLTEGMVKLTQSLSDGSQQITSVLSGKGQRPLLGAELLLQKCYASEARTLTPTRLCRIAVTPLQRSLGESAETALGLIQSLQTHLLQSHRRLLETHHKTAPQRLAGFLYRLSQELAPHPGDGLVIQLPFSKMDIANFLGMSPETLSRAFKSLQRARAIDAAIRGSQLEILNLQRLTSLAGAE